MTQSSSKLVPTPLPNLMDLMDDGLPSYDTATSAPIYQGSNSAEGSSSSAPLAPQGISRQAAYLFSGPPKAVNLSESIPHDIQHIHVCSKTSVQQFPAQTSLTRIISSEIWDQRLEDPAVLYNFLRSKTNEIPKVRLRCTGAHTETSYRDETVTVNGHVRHRKKGESHRVIDFDFYIDMTDIISPDGVALSVIPAWKPANRGTHTWAYGSTYSPRASGSSSTGYAHLADSDAAQATAPGRSLTWSERSAYSKWNFGRWAKGFPTWAKRQDVDEIDGEQRPDRVRGVEEEAISGDEGQEASLMEWCEAFCADKGWMKSFTLRREVWGWNFEGLIKATRGAIASTGYTSSDLTVGIEVDDAEITIRPNNLWSRSINRPFVYFLMWLGLVFPLFWVLNRLSLLPSTGRKYDPARSTYNLKPFPPLPSTYPGESISQATDRLPSIMKLNPQLPRNPFLRLGPKGVHYLSGKREGEWFSEWEERVRMATQLRFQGELVGRRETQGRVSLDGYERNWEAADQ